MEACLEKVIQDITSSIFFFSFSITELEFNPSGQALTDTPITVSDGQPVSLQKEDTFESRERGSHVEKTQLSDHLLLVRLMIQ